MRLSLSLAFLGFTIPANTQSYTFVPVDEFRPTAVGLKSARAWCEMRLLIGTPDAVPALQFSNTTDAASPAVSTIGTNATANGYVPPTTATDVSANMAAYLYFRPGYQVKNTHATNVASCVVGAHIDLF